MSGDRVSFERAGFDICDKRGDAGTPVAGDHGLRASNKFDTTGG